MFSRLFVSVLSVVGLGLFFGAVADALDTPVVYRDAESRNCVAIEDPNGLRSCRQQPDRFEVVYVEPGLTFEGMMRLRSE